MSANNTQPKHQFNARMTTALVLALAVVVAALVFLAMESASADSGTTWYVDDDADAGGTGSEQFPFQTITQAHNASDHGDTIRVYDGTYHEELFIYNELQIIGNGTGATILDGNGTKNPVMKIIRDGVTLSGFTITGYSGINTFLGALFVQADLCEISNCTFNDNEHDILVEGDGNRILNNQIVGTEYQGTGITIEYNYRIPYPGTNNSIVNNTVEGKETGIIVEHGNENIIEGNTVMDSGWGIALFGVSFDNVAANNTCVNNSFGIAVDATYRSRVLNNTLNNLAADIWVVDCQDSEFSRNTMGISGFFLGGDELNHYSTHTIPETNTVDGTPLLYLTDTNEFEVPNGYAQVILANCTSGSIQGMDFQDSAVGVTLGFCSDITIQSCTFRATEYGILADFCPSLIVLDSTFSDSTYGIRLDSSPTGIITNCSFSDHSWYGLFAGESSGMFLSRSSFTSCEASGLYLGSSDTVLIHSSSFTQNDQAITVRKSHDVRINNNSMDRNTFGIVPTKGSSDVTVRNNTIGNTTNLGVDCTDNQEIAMDARYNFWGDDSGPYHPLSSKLAQYGHSSLVGDTRYQDYTLMFPASSLKFRTLGFPQYGFKCKRISAR